MNSRKRRKPSRQAKQKHRREQHRVRSERDRDQIRKGHMTHNSEGPDIFGELQKIHCGWRINRASEWGIGENCREILKDSFEKDPVSQVS